MIVAACLETRGIRIYTVIYRSWGGIYYDELQPWQEAWADPGLHGANRTHEALEPYIEIGLEVSFALSDQLGLSAASLDGIKHFDYFIFELTAAVLTRAGLPGWLVTLLLNLWTQQRITLRLVGHYSRLLVLRMD